MQKNNIDSSFKEIEKAVQRAVEKIEEENLKVTETICENAKKAARFHLLPSTENIAFSKKAAWNIPKNNIKNHLQKSLWKKSPYI